MECHLHSAASRLVTVVVGVGSEVLTALSADLKSSASLELSERVRSTNLAESTIDLFDDGLLCAGRRLSDTRKSSLSLD